MPKVKGLTQKQAKFVEGIADGLPAYKAAAKAYDTNGKLNVANSIAVENLQKPAVRDAVIQALADHQITVFDIVAPAKKALSYQGETERDTIETQLKGTDRLMRLLAMTEDKQNNSGGNTLIFNDNRKTTKYVE